MAYAEKFDGIAAYRGTFKGLCLLEGIDTWRGILAQSAITWVGTLIRLKELIFRATFFHSPQ